MAPRNFSFQFVAGDGTVYPTAVRFSTTAPAIFLTGFGKGSGAFKRDFQQRMGDISLVQRVLPRRMPRVEIDVTAPALRGSVSRAVAARDKALRASGAALADQLFIALQRAGCNGSMASAIFAV